MNDKGNTSHQRMSRWGNIGYGGISHSIVNASFSNNRISNRHIIPQQQKSGGKCLSYIPTNRNVVGVEKGSKKGPTKPLSKLDMTCPSSRKNVKQNKNYNAMFLLPNMMPGSRDGIGSNNPGKTEISEGSQQHRMDERKRRQSRQNSSKGRPPNTHSTRKVIVNKPPLQPFRQPNQLKFNTNFRPDSTYPHGQNVNRPQLPQRTQFPPNKPNQQNQNLQQPRRRQVSRKYDLYGEIRDYDLEKDDGTGFQDDRYWVKKIPPEFIKRDNQKFLNGYGDIFPQHVIFPQNGHPFHPYFFK